MALPKELVADLSGMVATAERTREAAIDVMYALQRHYGYLCDEAMEYAARLLGMTTLELESLATFYDFLYRRPVGRYVIHVCDSVVCWMFHQDSIFDYLCRTLGVPPGGTTEDGLFTVLPAACIGNCHNAPTMLINGRFYDRLHPEKINAILDELRAQTTEEDIRCK
ncbi:NADH dehydrogenase (quinone) [Solidesulfovibrio carbinoliphilus subsp. oakridgensis]|uniref:NADH dehydrogenase (Quinone) n=1 Tax=Solidesulfovibrio carbinoliphilus subsp. oakridgensis TaxID=694327 RepID=G7QCY4_9BACT|nr:NADH-quinone oxidoreductase subunit NuoE [Solidesulfovibrio carbinoliphilus]EHJ46290.1 NADH dehydrogenase (quinone) [Solidesulfovibrio carbinoliphilus subsp. oakridgensis]